MKIVKFNKQIIKNILQYSCSCCV